MLPCTVQSLVISEISKNRVCCLLTIAFYEAICMCAKAGDGNKLVNTDYAYSRHCSIFWPATKLHAPVLQRERLHSTACSTSHF